jgi:hypothetical protein
MYIGEIVTNSINILSEDGCGQTFCQAMTSLIAGHGGLFSETFPTVKITSDGKLGQASTNHGSFSKPIKSMAYHSASSGSGGGDENDRHE